MKWIEKILRVLSAVFLIFNFLLISACNKSGKKQTPTSGELQISADESFYPLINAQINTFEALYSEAKISANYKSEAEALQDFINGKVDMTIISRELNEKEKDYFKSKNLSPTSAKIAIDGLAFIIHKDNIDSLLNMDQLKNLFRGRLKKWRSQSEEDIQIVVDKGSSSNLIYIDEKFGLVKDSIKIYAAGSNSKVIEYVKNNRNTIGVIGLNWISDYDDPSIRTNLKFVNIVKIGKSGELNPDNFYKPSQSNLAEGKYPVERSLYMINRNEKVGLGTGFATFLVSDRGQRIVLKAGILPAIMPGREIEVK